MNAPLFLLLALAGTGVLASQNEKANEKINYALFKKILAPLRFIKNDFYTNRGLMIDDIFEDNILLNTMYKNLYGIKIEGHSNTPVYFDMDNVKTFYKSYQDQPNAFFWYVILKDGYYHRQYIFSYNKNLIKTIGDNYNLKFLTGKELANIVLDLYLQNKFYIKDKDIHRTISLNFESNYKTFGKLQRENIYQNLNKTDLYQGYKAINGIGKTDISELLKMPFKGAVWVYFDITQKNIEKHISRLITSAKWTGNKTIFTELKESYDIGEQDLIIVNATAHFKEIDESILGKFGNTLKMDFIKKDIFKTKTLQKTPLKYRDAEFDFLAPLEFLGNYISCVQKSRARNADFWGLDKNGGFVNYSFAGDNDNPHAFVVANTGAGKSFTIQKILVDMIDVDYNNAYAKNLGKDKILVRYFDIGYSNEKLLNYLKTNLKNNIAHIESEFSNFNFNLCNIDFSDNTTIEEDLVFMSDLANIILSTQPNADLLTTGETALFKKILHNIYKNNDFQDYRIRDIENAKLKDKLLKQYDLNFYLKNLPEEYDFLKKPLLLDVIKYAKIQAENQQISEEDRKNYASLSKKLNDINDLKYFSNFDAESVVDADFLSMDLNNFKESMLFTPIFVSIFQKIYLKDRKYAIKCKRDGKKISKKLYIMEESANFFRVPYFCVLLEKLALEARKYGVHLILIAQQLEHIPKQILKVVDTRIFLLVPDKKNDLISEVKKYFEPNQNVIDSLNNTERYELCIWYLKGVFNMKLQISDFEHTLFTTNPEELNKASNKGLKDG